MNRLRRRAILAAAAVVAIGVAWAGYAASSSGAPGGYVTATAALGDVTQTVNLTGSVTQADTWTPHFPVSAKVASVSVVVGQTVTAGQELARLDPTTLNTAVIDAQATLAAAQASVESDQSSSSSSATTTAAASSSAAGSSSSGGSGSAVTTASSNASVLGSGSSATSTSSSSQHSSTPRSSTGTTAGAPSAGGASTQALAGLAKKLAAAQHALQAATGKAARALSSATQICSNLGNPSTGSSSATPTATPTASPTATSSGATPSPSATSPSGGPTGSGGSGGTTASDCLSALTSAADAQQAVSAAQATVTSAANQYARAVEQAAAALAKTSHSSGTTSTGSTGGGTTSGSSGTTTGGSTTRSATGSSSSRGTTGASTLTSQSSNTASQNSNNGQNSGGSQSAASRLITDQAAVSSAQVALDDAKINLAGAVLRAPADGTVAAVGLAVGGTASTASTITITQPGPANVTVDVPLTSMPKLKLGETVQVSPDGSTTPLSGSVSSIGLLPVSSTSSTPTYPVVVSVPGAGAALAAGSRAQVSITVGTANSVLTVPNSALTAMGNGNAFVNVVTAGKATRTVVQTGMTGQTRTQVVSGLKAGQVVVLADRSQALPSNSSTNIRGLTTTTGAPFAGAGGGGFGGGGGAGGFGGGAARPGG